MPEPFDDDVRMEESTGGELEFEEEWVILPQSFFWLLFLATRKVTRLLGKKKK